MANTFKFGNGNWAVKDGSALAYNDENNNFKPLPFDFTRASLATTLNRQGLIETVGSGKPRVDFTDNTDGHLLLEPSRTNYITYSEDFSQWTKLIDGNGVNPIVTTNEVISPDGTQNADKIIFNRTSAGSSDYTLLKKDYGGTDINGTASIYLKSDYNVNIEITSDDLNYKTITVTTDWKRFEVSDATSDRLTFGLRGSEPSTLNATVYAWGAQLEAGSYPTSYIPTEGSSVTRVAEAANGAGNSTVFNGSEGVLYAEIAALYNDGTNRSISISDSTNANRIELRLATTDDRIQYNARTSSVTQASIFTDAYDVLDYNKIAVVYKDNDFRLFVNGTQVATDTSGSAPTGLKELAFDLGDGSNDFYGKVKDIKVYNTALTDAELQALTS